MEACWLGYDDDEDYNTDDPWQPYPAAAVQDCERERMRLTSEARQERVPKWVDWLLEGDLPPLPETGGTSLSQVPRGQLQQGLQELVALVGVGPATACLSQSPRRLVGLLEMFALFRILESPIYRLAHQLLGAQILQVAAMRWGEAFCTVCGRFWVPCVPCQTSGPRLSIKVIDFVLVESGPEVIPIVAPPSPGLLVDLLGHQAVHTEGRAVAG